MNTITRQQLQQAVEAGIARAADHVIPVPDDVAAALREVAATTTAVGSNFRGTNGNYTGCVLDQILDRDTYAGYGSTPDERAWGEQFVSALDSFLSDMVPAYSTSHNITYKVTP